MSRKIKAKHSHAQHPSQISRQILCMPFVFAFSGYYNPFLVRILAYKATWGTLIAICTTYSVQTVGEKCIVLDSMDDRLIGGLVSASLPINALTLTSRESEIIS